MVRKINEVDICISCAWCLKGHRRSFKCAVLLPFTSTSSLLVHLDFVLRLPKCYYLMDGTVIVTSPALALPQLGFRCSHHRLAAPLLNSLLWTDGLQSLGRQNLEAIQIYYKDPWGTSWKHRVCFGDCFWKGNILVSVYVCHAYWKYSKCITTSPETLLTIMWIARGIDINS